MRADTLYAGLDGTQKERFARDGFLFPIRILSRDAAHAARERVLALLDEREGDAGIDDFLGYKTNLGKV